MSTVPVVLIHGLWLHATSWQPWIERFDSAGFETHAPTWPGEHPSLEETRAQASDQAGATIGSVTEHFAAFIDQLEQPPILIGHSFGGLIAQKLLADGKARAAVAISPAGIRGVRALPVSQLRSAWPVLSRPATRRRAVSLTSNQFAYAFGNALPRTESDELFDRWNIPAPGRLLFQAATANFSAASEASVKTDSPQQRPLLFIAGGRDHTVPESVVRGAYNRYDTSGPVHLETMADRGHSLVVDQGWSGVADLSERWISDVALQPGR